MSAPSHEPTQPPIQWARTFLSQGYGDHSAMLTTDHHVVRGRGILRMCGSIYPNLLYTSQRTLDKNLTFTLNLFVLVNPLSFTQPISEQSIKSSSQVQTQPLVSYLKTSLSQPVLFAINVKIFITSHDDANAEWCRCVCVYLPPVAGHTAECPHAQA